jgi:hypothetical protein
MSMKVNLDGVRHTYRLCLRVQSLGWPERSARSAISSMSASRRLASSINLRAVTPERE